MKVRLDVLLVSRGLAESREKAKAVIMEGKVFVKGQREDKAGAMFDEAAPIEIHGQKLRYVSRGGLKLEKAVEHFDLKLEGKVCMDVGSSTGGFTDCMLQNGAAKVYAVDVGTNQLDWKLRSDPRVVCMEKTNIRYLLPEQLDEKPEFASIDVAFISLTKVLRPVRELLTPDEVRRLDNRYAILLIRGTGPVMDLKYDLMKHPAVRQTSLAGGPPYIHHRQNQAPVISGHEFFAAFSTDDTNENKENAA